MRHFWAIWVLAFTVGMILLGAIPVAAQSGTPATDCEMTPLELPLFGGTPVAELSTPVAENGGSADAVPEAEIEAVLEQYVACTNTGDPTLVWAMFSPRWFSTTFADPEEHYLPAFERNLDNPEETVVNPLEVVGIEEIVSLDDGRVDVAATFRSGGQEWTDTLTLVNVGGEWLIDDVRLDTGIQ